MRADRLHILQDVLVAYYACDCGDRRVYYDLSYMVLLEPHTTRGELSVLRKTLPINGQGVGPAGWDHTIHYEKRQ